LKGVNPLVEYSFDPDDYDRRDDFDFRRDEAREQQRIDEMRRQDALDDFYRDAQRRREQEAMREVINNDNIKIDNDLQKIVNDARMVMDERGTIRKLDKRAMENGRSRIRRSGQFSRQNLLPSKRTRKKTKTDKNMSKALREANAKFRKKNGQLRKGKTMRDVMRYAHKCCRKMK
tara:strand:+ start:842 stop:1366 length:525 start_codon:yes stop_codon:yes gene_type:complete